MNKEAARNLAATAWCKEITKNKDMDPALCEVFAEMLLDIYRMGLQKGFGSGYQACVDYDYEQGILS